NGGVSRWRAERRGWSTELPPLDGSGTFDPLPLPRNTCTFDDLTRYRMRSPSMGKLPPVTLLDARTLAEYKGEDSREKAGGHIPGAASLPWNSTLSGKAGARIWK